MALEDVLARTPGLAGFLGRQQFDREQSLAGLQQATAATTLAANLKAQQEGAQIKAVLAESPDLQTAIPKLAALGPTGIATATHLAALEKARKSNELMSNAMSGGGLADPDTLDRLAQAHLAAGDHTNAAAIGTLADKRRAQMRDAIALTGMKSTPAAPSVAPDVQETQQAADQGLAAPVPSAPVPAQPGGVPEYLLQSPHVGQSAKALQQRINAGLEPTADVARKRVENLETAHNAMAQRMQDVAAARAGRIELRQTPPAGSERTAGAITNEAYARIINGKGTAGFASSGAAGEPTRAAVANKMEDIRQELGWTPVELATKGPENKTKFTALGAIEKDLAAIGPFHDMLNTNAKIAIQLADRIASDRTGSQWLNKPLTWLQANAADNPDIAEYLFQMQTVKTEGARILNNPRLVGQLTDSARHEMGDVVNGNMPFGQTRRVLTRMMSDGDNRVNALAAQRDKTIQEIRGSAGTMPTQQPAAIPAAGIASPYVEIRVTPSGKRLGKKTDGTIEEIR